MLWFVRRLFNDAESVIEVIQRKMKSEDCMLCEVKWNEQEEVVVAYFVILHLQSLVKADENYDKSSREADGLAR